MLKTRNAPVGMDWHIQALQSSLYNRLGQIWTNPDAYLSYGRCYRNRSADGYIAENYEGGRDFREVYWDDSLKALSFFGVSALQSMGPKASAQVHLVFFVNLEKLAPSVSHRADEEIRTQVLEAIGAHAYGFTVDSVELWLENVLREYPGSRRDERLKAVDMHPVHCFRVNMTLLYNPNKNC